MLCILCIHFVYILCRDFYIVYLYKNKISFCMENFKYSGHWHRDREDRDVTVLEGSGWQLQMDNRLPVYLTPGKTYHIPRNTYHRVIKGNTDLLVEIKEICYD